MKIVITDIVVKPDGMYDVYVSFNDREMTLTLLWRELSAETIKEKVDAYHQKQLEGIMNRLNKELQAL